MKIPIRYSLILSLLLAPGFLSGVSQSGKLGPKEPIASATNSKDSEMDHMHELVTKLKSEIPAIQDPAAKQAAADNLDLWQHLIDRMLTENKNANNSGHAHHHVDSPADPALKQSPKPQWRASPFDMLEACDQEAASVFESPP